MRSLRARAALGVVLLAVSSAACAARSELQGVGTSSNDAPGGATSQADGVAAAGAAHGNPIPKDFRTAWTHVNGHFVSVGHAGGRWEADVYAEGNAANLLRAGHVAAPVGTRFVEEHSERGDAGAGPTFMMEKRPAGFDPAHGDWRYVAVGASGEVAADGPVASCAGCHGDAPGDHVFRVGNTAE